MQNYAGLFIDSNSFLTHVSNGYSVNMDSSSLGSEHLENIKNMMIKNVIILFIAIVIPQTIFPQKWHSYSDSIIVNIRKNDFEKASRFVELADKEINTNTNLKDTIYADYIYRKSVLQGYLSGNYNLTFLKDALKIWESNHNKNHFKNNENKFFYRF